MFCGVLLQEMLRNESITEGKMETKDVCVGVCTCECLCSSMCVHCYRESSFVEQRKGCMCVDYSGRRGFLCVPPDVWTRVKERKLQGVFGAQYESVFLVLMSRIRFFSACVWVVTSLSLGMRRSLWRGDSDSNKKRKKRGRDGGRQERREGSWTGRLVYAASELSPLWVCKFGLTGRDAGPHLTWVHTWCFLFFSQMLVHPSTFMSFSTDPSALKTQGRPLWRPITQMKSALSLEVLFWRAI